MSYSREVITLQIGNYSNYVGTHWWNIQVSNNQKTVVAIPNRYFTLIFPHTKIHFQGSWLFLRSKCISIGNKQ